MVDDPDRDQSIVGYERQRHLVVTDGGGDDPHRLGRNRDDAVQAFHLSRPIGVLGVYDAAHALKRPRRLLRVVVPTGGESETETEQNGGEREHSPNPKTNGETEAEQVRSLSGSAGGIGFDRRRLSLGRPRTEGPLYCGELSPLVQAGLLARGRIWDRALPSTFGRSTVGVGSPCYSLDRASPAYSGATASDSHRLPYSPGRAPGRITLGQG